MTVGTKSILFGYHAFWLHPFMVAYAWFKLYGFPRRWQLWAAFFLHDIGYWGKPNMDGREGQRHPKAGAMLMLQLTDSWFWYEMCLYHSRQYAKIDNQKISALCAADKLAGCLYPNWLAIALCWLSGELKEYMMCFNRANATEWANMYRVETTKWLDENQ